VLWCCATALALKRLLRDDSPRLSAVRSRAPLERVLLLLTDEPGDAPQLKSAITEAWQAVGRRMGQTLRIVQLQHESGAELDGLFRVAAKSAAQAA
jgi:hypothetical protein